VRVRSVGRSPPRQSGRSWVRPSAGIKDCAGLSGVGSLPYGRIPIPVPHLVVAVRLPPKEIPLAKIPRQAGLTGWFCGGSTGRAVRKDDAAAEIPPFATGADVDCGSLADGQHSYETFGGKPRPVPASGRDRPWASSSLAAHIAVCKGLMAGAPLRWKAALGTQWGQMDGRGNRASSLVVGACPPVAGRPLQAPHPLNCPGLRAALSSGEPCKTGGPPENR
jgi:hypothetical protein